MSDLGNKPALYNQGLISHDNEDTGEQELVKFDPSFFQQQSSIVFIGQDIATEVEVRIKDMSNYDIYYNSKNLEVTEAALHNNAE